MNYIQINDLIKEGHQIGIHGLEHEDYGKSKLEKLKK